MPQAERARAAGRGASASSPSASCRPTASSQTFFNDEYLPKTRDSIAAADLPDGKAYYDFLAGYYTTTDLTADQIHAIGLKEVARIRAEMEKVKAEVGFKGTLAEFFTYLRTDPKFFDKTPEALLDALPARMSKRIDPELVKVFRTIPRLPYGVRPIPDNIAPGHHHRLLPAAARSTAAAPATTTSTCTSRRCGRPGK